MKKSIIGISLLLISQFAFSQSLTLTQLIDLNEMSWDNFDTYVINKEYSFSKTVKTKYKDGSFHYDNKTYSTKLNGLMASYFITKYISESSKSRMIRYQTAKSKDYAMLKKEISDLGFVSTKNYSVSDSVIVFEYKKDEIQLQVYSHLSKNAANTNSTVYEICLTTY